MGYFEIGIYQPIHTENIGTLWRTAYQMGASGIFVIGKPPRRQTSDTARTNLNIPLRVFPGWSAFQQNRPQGARIVGIEMGGEKLATFKHPEQAIYVLGSEANGLPSSVRSSCDHIVSIESIRSVSFNVAVSGAIVLYHRWLQFGFPTKLLEANQ